MTVIISEIEMKDHVIQVRKSEDGRYDVGNLTGDIFDVKHSDVGADGAIRVISHYLQSAVTKTWKRVRIEPEAYGEYLVKIKGHQFATIARFDHPIDQRQTGWYICNDDLEFSYAVDVEFWDFLPS